MMTIDERWEARGSAGALVMVRGSAGALMVVGIYSEIMDGCEGLGPAQWILAYERGEMKSVIVALLVVASYLAVLVSAQLRGTSVCARKPEAPQALDDLACKQLYDYSMKAVGLDSSPKI
ncbi:hypothetical protein PRIPAC_94263 [Pristionchus pacificus]|uniref:Uncharacterized protein n=1 Tax=Pristionchus pacificus TaxID=54126 RepID=A0A2A6BBT1_PRIPA|nr:hypothetical protein PRIPAC_94263 [Pristionchus pacificus]|eukprot:PDM63330.1 hypothetical protein PRIPAC_50545 [Pristionchus pacificus]